ncbi:hypothetical protein SECTIM467_115 [Brevibacillus phage SecTim467]|uniref:Uncharacterized protein n=2 Tax=Jenstvirus jenst TaxID=1982225 RepID=A0A0K2CPA7_9CAUD|nr:hypothetical protein AVV11_gp081 [Brevibacillus phage Jenst]ALA07239.1 hypothetical protein JENST_110 [Brevibacillus phage Jenst]ALA07563.1 hypothetical protein SECTIM467_115 [Brevibacillus phage SecTim467]
MKVKMTAIFFLDNGKTRRVEWLVGDAKMVGIAGKDGEAKPVEIVLKNVKDVLKGYKQVFSKYHRENEIFAVENIKGEVTGVLFSKVTHWSIKAEEVKDDVAKPTDNPVIK